MIEITERDFNKEVLKYELPVFTCFTTKWCQSCYPTCLFVDKLAKEYEGRLKFVKVDIKRIPAILAGYHITVVPTIYIIKDCKTLKKLIGFQELRSLRNLLNNVVNESDELSNSRMETKGV